MKLTVNGKETVIESLMTIKQFIESKGLNSSAVVVEHNYNIPDREKWDEIYLKDGDNLEIVKFIGGG